MTNQDRTYKLNNGGVLSNIVKHSNGTMSSRYTGDYSVDGESAHRVFFKLFRGDSDSCTSPASREIQKNEILVLEFIKLHFPQLTLYEGYSRVNGALCILSKFIPGLGKTTANTLWDLMGVDDDFKDITAGMETADSLIRKRRVVAENKLNSLEEAVYLSTEMCEQADLFHGAQQKNADGQLLKDGMVLVDISPSNVLIYQDNEGRKKVLLNDFGLARERGIKAEKLYSRASVSGVGGSYYTTKSGITVNRVYHPPNFDKDYENSIEPSYDTYNLVNILCLMLTGKLVEPLKEESKEDQTILTQHIIDKVKERYPFVKDETCQDLAKMIVKGTSTKDERYSSAGKIAEELKALRLSMPVGYQANHPTINLIALPGYLKECQLDLPPNEEMKAAHDIFIPPAAPPTTVSDEAFLASVRDYCSKPKELYLLIPIAGEAKMSDGKKKQTFRKALKIGIAAVSAAAIAAAGYFISTSDGCEYKLHAYAPPTVNLHEKRGDNGKIYELNGIIKNSPYGLSNVKLYEDNTLIQEWSDNLGTRLDVNREVSCPYGRTYTLEARDKFGGVGTDSIEIKPQEFGGKMVDCREKVASLLGIENLGESTITASEQEALGSKYSYYYGRLKANPLLSEKIVVAYVEDNGGSVIACGSSCEKKLISLYEQIAPAGIDDVAALDDFILGMESSCGRMGPTELYCVPLSVVKE